MSKLHISPSLSLPIDAVTQKFGILGRTGSGKSYAATKLAEEMAARELVYDYGEIVRPNETLFES